MTDQYGTFWGPTNEPSTTISTSYAWYTPTTQALEVPGGYSPSATSSNPSTSGFDFERATSSKSPLNTLAFDLLQSVGPSDKKINRDGQPAKRRGPKPDHKPAMTRRQELNRQAQRTHRQKKENYIKVLEEQNEQLKEAYNECLAERDNAWEENRKLKEILRTNGILYRDNSTTSKFPKPLVMANNDMRTYAMSRPIPSQTSTSSIGMIPTVSQNEYHAAESLMVYRSSSVIPQSHHYQQPQLQQSSTLEYDQIGADYMLVSTQQDKLPHSVRSHSMPGSFTPPFRRAPP